MASFSRFLLACTVAGVLGIVAQPLGAWAQATSTDSNLQGQINTKNDQIAEIQQEIQRIQGQLDSTSKEKQTLQGTVAELDLSIKKVTADISLTQTRIGRTDLEIRLLSGSIATTTDKISDQRAGIAETLRSLNLKDGQSQAVDILGGETLSSFFDEVAALGAVRDELGNQIEDLTSLKTTLVTNKNTAQNKRSELSAFKSQLAGQQKALSATRAEKNQLLAQTKNQESSYQALLAEKRAQERQFEQELLSMQNELNLHVNVSALPNPGSGVLSWPIANTYPGACPAPGTKYVSCITQYFGNTDFATKNPQIYNGKGHNAIDLRASPGTPIRAARGAIVRGTGNTDLQRGCYSFGKWILLEHDNGLSTLYAHLSVINVGNGQRIGGGEVIGYSGSTGYATGPHLHFTVYATDGVEIVLFSRSINCKNVSIPIADPSAYLNPLSYL